MENLAYPAYRSWGRSFCLWALTNAIGFAIMSWGLAGKDKDGEEIAAIIGACAALGSLLAVPLFYYCMAYALAVASRTRRIASTLAMAAGLVVLTCLGLAILTGGLGALAVAFGGWAYLPAALLAVPWPYADWLLRADDAPDYSAAEPWASPPPADIE